MQQSLHIRHNHLFEDDDFVYSSSQKQPMIIALDMLCEY